MNRDDERVINGMMRLGSARDEALADSDRLGWKSGFGTEMAMSLIEVSQPLVGFMTTSTLASDGAVVDVAAWGMPLIESEIAVRIDRELGPGATPEEGAAAIGAVAAAIELVDLGSIESVEEILAGNIFHRKVILGDFEDCSPGELEDLQISLKSNGTATGPVDPRDLIGDIGKVVAAMADQADLIGETFKPGDVVITGAAVPPAPLSSGESHEVEVASVGSVSVSIA